MKHFLKWVVIALSAVFALGLGRMLAAKALPMIPAINRLSQRVQEWIFDLIALATGIAGAVVGSKLARRFLGGGGAGVSVTK